MQNVFHQKVYTVAQNFGFVAVKIWINIYRYCCRDKNGNAAKMTSFRVN